MGVEGDRFTPGHDITVSSQFGVSGTVEINDFTTDSDSGLVERSSELICSGVQITQGCVSGESRVTVVG